jgi:hypothetical protein
MSRLLQRMSITGPLLAPFEKGTPGTRILVNGPLTGRCNNTLMRVAMAAVVALLVLNFADEHFNSARYTQAAMAMFSQIARSFS